MKSNIPQIKQRTIGSVAILDFHGELVGPWALRAKDTISSMMRNMELTNLLINLKELETVDSLGARAVADNISAKLRCGVIRGRLSVMEMFARLHMLNEVTIFQDEEEVVAFFGEDFVKENHHTFMEKRESERLRTAIPLEFSYVNSEDETIVFKAIVTDLSDGGLFAEYLDLETVDTVHKDLDPYELQMLELRLKIPQHDTIIAQGKVLRTVIEGEQLGLGIQFYSIADADRAYIVTYLKS